MNSSEGSNTNSASSPPPSADSIKDLDLSDNDQIAINLESSQLDDKGGTSKPGIPDNYILQQKSTEKQTNPSTDQEKQNPSPKDQEEGGEWDLLVQKIKKAISQENLSQQWIRLKQPLFIFSGLVIFLLTLRIYSTVLATIAKVPLAPRLFELSGFVWLIWFSSNYLLRSKDRKELISALTNRWKSLLSDSE